jgi:hypothetical protein
VRVTEAYPGEDGKRRVIEAYLNQNYYGNGSYGVLAAARGYFGVQTLDQLSLSQIALLAALPHRRRPTTGRNAFWPRRHAYVPLNTGLPIVAGAPCPDAGRLSERRVLTGDSHSAALSRRRRTDLLRAACVRPAGCAALRSHAHERPAVRRG